MAKAHALSYTEELVNGKAVNAAIGVLFFIMATALGAYIRIPVAGTPVPITLQTLFVVLSGAILGRKLGGFSQFCYFALGAAGVPVFQGYSAGLSYVFGPTGGYIIGFIFAAYLIGRLLESREFNIYLTAGSFIAGNIALYAFGVSWLTHLYKIDIMKAASIGILPFLPGEIIKISAAVMIYSVISHRAKKIFSS